MNQAYEIIVLIILLTILVLKPNNVTAYIKTHLGRLMMVSALIYLTLRNYLYGIIALAIIVLSHEMRIVEGNENMGDAKKLLNRDDEDNDDNDEDDNDEDDNDEDDNDENDNDENEEDENEEDEDEDKDNDSD
jgi:uncharacterized membrane protein YukC